ncbi:hypothetical protein C3747_111g832c [Trypanosoma cruzi]|uniref:Uncharacterized protein n=2 Tax=Trypanosoma cruzi TaxID=5693 RepID=Q4CXN8_TRYCC|nr:hypothetical protein, conserved [Trypanosoma cruzi]EAN85040.1 hypothetical protein, conserved [Trypanosoma cruzi]PWV06694.1 hypothetical protein C3747_111g832c [Trypanosoma cruzi]RNC55374.1 hypothetical protein TcCL_ESM07130 [Trypanosoma cruzi]|eukprot:XP_806891.1 hypothetical protein [Trypanosoma cruzi strain CL Brener]
MSSSKTVTRGRFLAPFCKVACKIEKRSARKLNAVDACIAKTIAEHNASGTDAAVSSTKRYIYEQKQLFHYRVVRFFDECRYLASGEYFRTYSFKDFVWDIRFFTKFLLLFILGTLFGRQSIFPPIDPDSPLALALESKVNPNY